MVVSAGCREQQELSELLLVRAYPFHISASVFNFIVYCVRKGCLLVTVCSGAGMCMSTREECVQYNSYSKCMRKGKIEELRNFAAGLYNLGDNH